jgi:hypothetical protein
MCLQDSRTRCQALLLQAVRTVAAAWKALAALVHCREGTPRRSVMRLCHQARTRHHLSGLTLLKHIVQLIPGRQARAIGTCGHRHIRQCHAQGAVHSARRWSCRDRRSRPQRPPASVTHTAWTSLQAHQAARALSDCTGRQGCAEYAIARVTRASAALRNQMSTQQIGPLVRLAAAKRRAHPAQLRLSTLLGSTSQMLRGSSCGSVGMQSAAPLWPQNAVEL